MFESCLNYSEQMEKGNEPAFVENGIEHWRFYNGEAQTKNGNIIGAKFSIKKTKCVHIIGDRIFCYNLVPPQKMVVYSSEILKTLHPLAVKEKKEKILDFVKSGDNGSVIFQKIYDKTKEILQEIIPPLP
jgi:hypothetical protein